LKEEVSVYRRSSIQRWSILKFVLVALVVAGFAGALLTGCERTISDDGSWLPETIQ
jgi:hypothetical protein